MAGCDIFIMPSRFEPCGLNQMYGLRYGTPPVVNNTGGLADSVQDTNEINFKNNTATGFVMQNAEPKALISAIERALGYYQDEKAWKIIQENGMRQNLDWTKSASAYLAMYQGLLEK